MFNHSGGNFLYNWVDSVGCSLEHRDGVIVKDQVLLRAILALATVVARSFLLVVDLLFPFFGSNRLIIVDFT